MVASRPVSRVLSGGLLLRDGHSSGMPVAGHLEQPTRAAGLDEADGPESPRAVVPPLFGLAPGGVCPASAVTGAAVRSYRTISPLPDAVTGKPGRVVGGMFLWHFPWGHPRRPLAATAHPWSPDFPPPTTEPEDSSVGRDRPADWHGGDRGHTSATSRLVRHRRGECPPCFVFSQRKGFRKSCHMAR